MPPDQTPPEMSSTPVPARTSSLHVLSSTDRISAPQMGRRTVHRRDPRPKAPKRIKIRKEELEAHLMGYHGRR